jgi:hypothetical protein
MKALKMIIPIVLIVVSFSFFVFSLTVNLFVDDVVMATYSSFEQGVNPAVGSQMMSIMADGYLTIIETDYLMILMVLSALVFYFSTYALAALINGYPLRSLFTKSYWYQFDAGISYRPSVWKNQKANKKKPGK